MDPAHVEPRERGPDFVGVGVQKSGTNWLADVLGQHPDVLIRKKEISFFVRHFHRGYGWYESLFEGKDGRLAGELSVNYIYSPRPDSTHREFYPRWNPQRSLEFWRRYPSACDALRTRCPGLRVFGLFRNPIERAWSHYWHWCRRRERNRKPIVPFERMFADDGRWIQTQGHYADLLAAWRKRFPDMGVFFYDDIKADPRVLARAIYRFVGVDEGFEPKLSRRVNVGDYRSMPESVRALLLETYRDQILRFQEMTGRDLSHWLTRP